MVALQLVNFGQKNELELTKGNWLAKGNHPNNYQILVNDQKFGMSHLGSEPKTPEFLLNKKKVCILFTTVDLKFLS